MQLHYLYSDKRTCRAATITFNGEVQRNAVMVNDETGVLVRRKFTNGLLDGNETLKGNVWIEIPAGVPKGPYKTSEKKP